MTIREIAKKANVGIATVSRAINNGPEISPRTRDKVLQIIKEVDYYPNMLARRLAKKMTSTVVVFIRGEMNFYNRIDWYYFGEILGGIQIVANEIFGYDVLFQISQSNQKGSDYMRFFHEQKVDGAIIVFPTLDDPGVKNLEETEVPAVLINSVSRKLDYVEIDNVSGTTRAIEHLIELGHKRIGMIRGRTDEIDFEERFKAYRSTLLKHDLSCIKELVIHGNCNQTTSYEAMKKLLVHKPTAVFAANDPMAIGAMKAIREAGLRIPEDIAVVGFDDIPVASFIVPSLTSVRQPFFEMGKEAVNMLIRRIGDKTREQQKKILPVELVVRASTKKDI